MKRKCRCELLSKTRSGARVFSPQAPAGKAGTVCKSATGPRPLESKRTANFFLSPFIRAFQSKASLEFIYRLMTRGRSPGHPWHLVRRPVPILESPAANSPSATTDFFVNTTSLRPSPWSSRLGAFAALLLFPRCRARVRRSSLLGSRLAVAGQSIRACAAGRNIRARLRPWTEPERHPQFSQLLRSPSRRPHPGAF